MSSIMLKLKKIASLKNIPINDLRIIVAIERIIARIESDSNLFGHLIFKGGFVLLKTLFSSRFTRDVDALAKGINRNKIIKLIPSVLKKDLKDGFWYGDVNFQILEEQGQYGGIRFDFAFQIDEIPKSHQIKKLSRLHLDIGFGDVIPKNINSVKMNSLIETSNPISWSIYPLEFIFSEKLQTIVERGSANSRAKDVFDLIILYEAISDKNKIFSALNETFQNRSTCFPNSFVNYLKSIDTSLIKLSWNSVKLIVDNRIDFEHAWEKLIKIAVELDSLLIR
jgi:predicted nucleotidyltransferase component of viral defense system